MFLIDILVLLRFSYFLFEIHWIYLGFMICRVIVLVFQNMICKTIGSIKALFVFICLSYKYISFIRVLVVLLIRMLVLLRFYCNLLFICCYKLSSFLFVYTVNTALLGLWEKGDLANLRNRNYIKVKNHGNRNHSTPIYIYIYMYNVVFNKNKLFWTTAKRKQCCALLFLYVLDKLLLFWEFMPKSWEMHEKNQIWWLMICNCLNSITSAIVCLKKFFTQVGFSVRT